MKESQEFFVDESLTACPFCGADARETDDLGRIKPGFVEIERRVRRRPWAELYPEDDRYYTSWAVVCGNCGASGGRRASRTAAIAAWQTRLTPDMTAEERDEERRAVEAALLEEPETSAE